MLCKREREREKINKCEKEKNDYKYKNLKINNLVNGFLLLLLL